MKDWLLGLAPRERLLVGTAGALVVLFVVIVFGLRPLYANGARQAQLVEDKEALLSELSDAAARLGPQRAGTGKPAATGRQSLVVLIDQTTRTYQLSKNLKRNQPDGSDSIRLRLENAPFDDVVQWLAELQNRHGLSAVSANIDAARAAGRVNCNLVLSRINS